jgi:hypothetical protein
MAGVQDFETCFLNRMWAGGSTFPIPPEKWRDNGEIFCFVASGSRSKIACLRPTFEYSSWSRRPVRQSS